MIGAQPFQTRHEIVHLRARARAVKELTGSDQKSARSLELVMVRRNQVVKRLREKQLKDALWQQLVLVKFAHQRDRAKVALLHDPLTPLGIRLE